MLVAVAIAMGTGCRDGHPATFPVQGTVHFETGDPVPVGIVEFRSQPDGRIAKGKIDQQGRFILGTFRNDDGAVPGPHQVVVTQHFDPSIWSHDRSPQLPLPTGHIAHEHEAGLVHRKYADYRTSGLTATVKPQSDNPIELVVGTPVALERPPNSKR